MDHRIALGKNTPLRLVNTKGEEIHCVIEKEIGRGGSCIVYEVSRKTDTGDNSLYRVKEFYPYGLSVSRDESNHLIPSARDGEAFHRQQKQFRLDFSRANRLFYSGNNYASMTNQLDVFEQNETSYVLSAYSSQKTLSAYKPESIKECIYLVKQVAYVLGNIHQQGFLYLDTKPDNILIVDGLQKQIQLFDFDSLVSLEELRKCQTAADGRPLRLSCSRGFAPVELQTLRLNHIGRHTDVYGVGALLFYLLFGRTPDAPDCEDHAKYSFKQMGYDHAKCDDRLFDTLTDFFHNSLAVYYADRYQTMEDVLKQLGLIEKYADITIPRIYSTKIVRPQYLLGRERELVQMDALLERKEANCVFLTGMGGIGKSTFIREYLAKRPFDVVLYVHYKGSMDATISDDNTIEINTLRQEEVRGDGTRYFHRKLQKIRDLVRGTRSVLVIDNFTGDVDADLKAILSTDLKVVLLTRRSPFYQNGLEMHLNAISDSAALRRLFEANLGRPISENEIPGFEEIRKRVDSHTLLLELIAKQIAASHITISRAAALTSKYGFSSIAPEKIDYERDNAPRRDTIGNIIDALFEAGSLSDEKKTLMKVASLLGDRGMNIHQFQQIMELPSKDGLNELIHDGWLMISGDRISMHKVIQEAVHRWNWSVEYMSAAERFLGYLYVELRIETTKNNFPEKLRKKYAALPRAELPSGRFGQRSHRNSSGLRSRKVEKGNVKSEVALQKRGIIGNLQREWAARAADESPADRGKIASLLSQAEEILRECKREEAIRANHVYVNLLYETVLNTPPYRENYILAETDDIFSSPADDTAFNGKAGPPDECDSRNPVTIMRLYRMAVIIHTENKRYEEAKKLIEQANNIADRVHHRRVYAQYYNLLSDYYDILLDGHYEPRTAEEEQLLGKMLDADDKTLHYARQDLSYDDSHLYAQSLLGKATILMRSGRGTAKKIRRLMEAARKIVFENTSPYAEVRLQYYLTWAWYSTLICGSESLTESCLYDVWKLSEVITSSDLRKIENAIIPSANMFFQLRSYDRALKLLFEGVQLCASHGNTDSYARTKQELCDHIWQVGIEAEAFEFCRYVLTHVDYENDAILDPRNKVSVPDEIRSVIDAMTN